MSTKRYDMARALRRLEQMTRDLGIQPLRILYCELDEKNITEDFTEEERRRFFLSAGDEVITITGADRLLYVVNVTADSVLAAAAETLGVIARKF